jgi:solute carrier family 36 (proton-coupled amino acid transporter)
MSADSDSFGEEYDAGADDIRFLEDTSEETIGVADSEEFLSILEGKELPSPVLEKPESLANDFRTVLNVIKANSGSGVLSLPYGFLMGGLVASPILLLIVGTFSVYCSILLVQCRNRLRDKQANSYGLITREVYGLPGIIFVEFFLLLTQVGVCVAFVVFIASNLANILGYFPFEIYCLLLFIPCWLLSCIRTWRMLAPISAAASLCTLSGVLLIAVYDMYLIYDRRGIAEPIEAVSISTMFIFIGIAVYTFEGIALVLPIENSMKKPSHFNWLFSSVIGAIFLAYAFFGTLCYAAIGPDIQEVITLNLPPDSLIGYTIALLLCGSLLGTYPASMFPTSEITERLIFSAKFWNKSDMHGTFRYWLQNAWRAALVLLTLVLAAFIGEQFGVLVSLIGSMGSAVLSFVLPCALHLKLFWKETSPPLKIMHAALCLVGCLVSIFGTIYSVYTIFFK